MQMFQHTLDLKATAFTKEQIQEQISIFEDQGMIQVVFAGRSNVGKSSLINALAHRKRLAKISSTPGKTRSLNFYTVDTKKFVIVDLPGYGYARCSQKERQKWAKLIEYYFLTSKDVKCLILLLDCRVPLQKLDYDLALFSRDIHLPVFPVLTKVDKCNQNEQVKRQQEWEDLFCGEKPLLVSAKKMRGIENLWKAMYQAVGLLL